MKHNDPFLVADAAQARADLVSYVAAMKRLGGEGECLSIEVHWGLNGYPPEVVCGALSEIGAAA